MSLTKEKRKSLIAEFRSSQKDSGSSPVQIAILTERIQTLSDHLKKCPKDFAAQRGLLKMVSRRRSLLSYLKKNDSNRYQTIIQRLDLRK